MDRIREKGKRKTCWERTATATTWTVRWYHTLVCLFRRFKAFSFFLFSFFFFFFLLYCFWVPCCVGAVKVCYLQLLLYHFSMSDFTKHLFAFRDPFTTLPCVDGRRTFQFILLLYYFLFCCCLCVSHSSLSPFPLVFWTASEGMFFSLTFQVVCILFFS